MIFDRYLFRMLLLAAVLIAVTLAAVIFLTQSLRFLELVIESGASGTVFWILTFLTLPRFFEIILPIALMAATIFVYNKMALDSELVVMRAAGLSPMALARPALAAAGLCTVLLWLIGMWIAPLSSSSMQQMRQVIKAQYSALLFREGIFNAVGDGLTVFIHEKAANGELRGIVIHDSRPQNEAPVTILAKSGVLAVTDEGQQVLVYEGSRQSVNPRTGTLDRLAFDRYSIDLPDGAGPVRQRWREPEERTFPELFHPDPDNARDAQSRREFIAEAHRRIIAPLLAPVYVLIALAFLLSGPLERRGQGARILAAAGLIVVIQAFFLGAYDIAQETKWGIVLMYALVLLPGGAGVLVLFPGGARAGRRILSFRTLSQRRKAVRS